jgi:hypothetical protein
MLSREQAASYRRLVKLKPGEYAIMVENTENALHRMTVHAKIVVNPSQEETEALGL